MKLKVAKIYKSITLSSDVLCYQLYLLHICHPFFKVTMEVNIVKSQLC